MRLEHGKTYRAEISLGFFEGIASNDVIAVKLTEAGFGEVVVSGTGRKRVAQGVWMGRPQEAELPKQVTRVWIP